MVLLRPGRRRKVFFLLVAHLRQFSHWISILQAQHSVCRLASHIIPHPLRPCPLGPCPLLTKLGFGLAAMARDVRLRVSGSRCPAPAHGVKGGLISTPNLQLCPWPRSHCARLEPPAAPDTRPGKLRVLRPFVPHRQLEFASPPAEALLVRRSALLC